MIFVGCGSVGSGGRNLLLRWDLDAVFVLADFFSSISLLFCVEFGHFGASLCSILCLCCGVWWVMSVYLVHPDAVAFCVDWLVSFLATRFPARRRCFSFAVFLFFFLHPFPLLSLFRFVIFLISFLSPYRCFCFRLWRNY